MMTTNSLRLIETFLINASFECLDIILEFSIVPKDELLHVDEATGDTLLHKFSNMNKEIVITVMQKLVLRI